MKLVNFVVWLATGAVIGWFAGRIIAAEQKLSNKLSPAKNSH